MSIRRMMLFTLGAKIKNLIEAFKTRVFAAQGEFEAETCLDAQLTDLNNKGLLDSASFVVTPNGYRETLLYAIEPDKVGTNLLLHSQDWTQAVWAKGGATIVSSTRVAPDGTSTGTELSDVGASSTPGVPVQDFITTSTTVTFSIYTKAVSLPTNGRRTFLLRNSTTATNFDILNFNYSSTGNLGNGWFSQNVGNGWFRLSYTRTTGISIGNALRIYYGRTDTAPVGATDVWQVWGAQVDTSNTLNEYIPTTSAIIINGTIGDMSVTRATTGTRVNADGLIEEVPYNLTQYSQNFENAVWSKGSAILTRNFDIAPDGSLTAAKYVPNSTNIRHDLSNFNLSFYNGKTITMSVYVKNAGNRYVIIGTIGTGIRFDFNTETITNLPGTAPLNSFVEVLPNGWYRIGCTISSLDGGRIAIVPSNIIINTTPAPFAGNDVDGVLVWGAQLVQGTQPKDYFPTTNRFNIPRIDYSNGSCPSILVEPQRTNLLLQSEDFTNGWSLEGTSITSNSQTAPDNLPSADTLSELATNDVHRTYRAATTITANTNYTTSFFIKKNNIRYVRLIINLSGAGSTTTWAGAQFDLDTQTFTSATGTGGGTFVSAAIVPFINGWYRISVTGSIPGTIAFFLLALSNGTAMLNTDSRGCPVYLGNTSNSLYVWGAQLEAGTNATSYIPTTTATATRNADVITNTNMSTLIGQTEGAMYIDFNYQRVNPLAESYIATISDGTISNSLLFSVLPNQNFAVFIRTAGINVIFISIPAASFTFGRKKIVISYKSGNTNLYVNGVKIGPTITNAFSFPVTINKFNLGSSWIGGGLVNNTINSAALWKTTLTNAQAIQLTTL